VQQYILLVTRDPIQLFVTGIRYYEVVINDMQPLCWWKAINSCNSKSYHNPSILVQTKWIFFANNRSITSICRPSLLLCNWSLSRNLWVVYATV